MGASSLMCIQMIPLLHAAAHNLARLYYQQMVNLENLMDAEKFDNHTILQAIALYLLRVTISLCELCLLV